MKKTNIAERTDYLTVNTEILAKRLCCGKGTAKKIGLNAEAKLKVGKRTLWIIPKIEDYLERIGTDGYEDMER